MDAVHDEHGERGSAPVRATWDHAELWPTAKQRAGVEQSVRRVLDALVPERAPPRRIEPRGAVQSYRSPRGCILQGDAWAVSVSWFPATATDESFGELRVISWSGVVSRPGATNRATQGARPVAEALLRPVASGTEAWMWRTTEGAVMDSHAVAERCLRLLTDHDPAPEPVAPGA